MDNKTHFIFGTKSYMLWHQGAILKGFIKKKDRKPNMYLGASGTWTLYVFGSDMEAK